MSVSYWADQSSEKTLNVDMVVIGGGIAGLSCAYWLNQEDPSLKVAVVEKGYLGSGATGRNAGFITCGSVEHFNRLTERHGAQEAYDIWAFSEKNLALLKEHVIRDQGEKLQFAEKGSFSLASTHEELKELQNSAELMRKSGISVEMIDEKGIEERLGAKHFSGGIHYLDDGSIHPMFLLRQLASLLPSSVQVIENSEVHSVENSGEGKRVKTRTHTLNSQAVIYATNGYSPLLHPFFDNKIAPTRGQILSTEAVPLFMESACYANFVLDYFRQLPTGEVLIGGFRQLQKDVEVGVSDETTPIIQKALEDFLKHHLPALKDAKVTHRWSGVMGFSHDGLPLIGSMPEDPQSFFASGFTAHGLGLAFHCGKTLVDMMYGREVPSFLSARR